MALTHPYCEVADVQGQLSDDGGRLSEALIERAINSASRAIDTYCGRRFWVDSVPTIRTYRPVDIDDVVVFDIASASGLVIKTDQDGDGTFELTWAASDYQLEPLNADSDGGAYAWTEISAIDHYMFPLPIRRRPTVQVTALHGWSEVPDAVNEACIIKAVSLFKRKDAPFGIAGFGEFGHVRITRKDPDVIELLNTKMRIRKPDF